MDDDDDADGEDVTTCVGTTVTVEEEAETATSGFEEASIIVGPLKGDDTIGISDTACT